MAAGTITITIAIRPWVRWYLSALVLFCRTFGTTPDVDRVSAFITRIGMKVTAP